MEAGPDEPDAPRLKVLLLAVGWGLLIGLAAGALAGTAVVPVVGTIIGAFVGGAVAVPPAVLGAIALWLAARPGTPHETFQRRVHVILGCIGALVAMVAYGAAVTGRLDTERVGGGVAIGCGLAIYLLFRADASIARVRPAPQGSAGTSRRLEYAAVGLLVAVCVGAVGWIAWDRRIGPEARGRRSVVGERDAIAHRMGLPDLYAYDLRDGARSVVCEVPGSSSYETRTGYLSYGTGSFEYGDVDDARDAVVRARRELADDGYEVSHGSSPQGIWVYGLWGDRSAIIRGPGTNEASRDDRSVTVRVAEGCIEPQPGLPSGGRDRALRLLGAGHVPPRGGGPATCPDGEPAEQVTAVANGWLGQGGALPRGWTLTTAAGRKLRPCQVTRDGAVVVLAVEASDDPVVRAAVSVVSDEDGDGLLDSGSTDLEVDVAPAGGAARALDAGFVTTDDDVTPIADGTCPSGTVQGVSVQWDRPLLAVNAADPELLRTAEPHRDYRVTIEREGRLRTVTPIAVEGPRQRASELFNSTGQILCLDEPGRPVRVRAAASTQLDLGGPATAAFELALPPA